MLIGLPFVTLGIVLLTILRSRLSIVGIVVPLFIVSAANSMVWPSLSKAVFAAAPREQTGSASGMFYTIRNIGMSLSQTLALVAAEFTVSPAVASDAFLGTSGSRNISLARALTHATDNGFLFFVAFFVIAIIFTFFLLRPQQHMTSTLHTEPATIVHETP